MLQAFNGNRGVSIIEILVVIAILAITLTVLLGMANFSLGVQGTVKQTIQAKDLTQEAIEAVRSIRDNAGWSQVTSGTYGLDNSGGYWSFSGSSNTINGFTRTISITDVQRDASDNIVESGGAADPNTKKITVAVSWGERGRAHNIELITYLTNWRR